jgi:C4-dicarboxylate-specific signal transduction histidine kinase
LFNENIEWIDFENNKDTTIVLESGVTVSDVHFDGITKWYGLPNNLILGFKNKFITFNFIGITLKQSREVKYQYKLEGIDENWSALTLLNEASYGNMIPGTYTFKVKAMNSEGYWSSEYSYPFSIKPPWWDTILFRILVAFFALAGLFSFYQWRVAILKKRQKQLEVIVKEKTNEVTEQKEELQASNEELLENVEELYNQREEMEATLYSLKETQEKLFQAEKMASIGILASGVAHEINNPLNFINGGIQGIETYIDDNLSDHKKNISPLIDAVNMGLTRATEIVKSLNSFSRQTESNSEKCDIHTIITNCLVMLNNQITNRVEIKKEFTNDLFTLTGNEGKLHQAVLNILTNAIQAIDGKGSVTISTRMHDSNILIIVHDTGYGISNKILNKIFDPFFTTREQGMGKGLGLSFSYQIIQEFNGTIDIQSEIGKWTTVTITLPVEKNELTYER